MDENGEYITTTLQEAADCEGCKNDFIRSDSGKDIEVLMDGHTGNSYTCAWDLPIDKAALNPMEPHHLFLVAEPLYFTDPWGY